MCVPILYIKNCRERAITMCVRHWQKKKQCAQYSIHSPAAYVSKKAHYIAKQTSTNHLISLRYLSRRDAIAHVSI